jgi:hypothetical protein
MRSLACLSLKGAVIGALSPCLVKPEEPELQPENALLGEAPAQGFRILRNDGGARYP